MKIFFGFLMVAGAWMGWAMAADSASYSLYSSKQLDDKAQELHGKMQSGLASETLGDWGNHSVLAVHREQSGQAEYHENQADVIMIRKGEGSMVLGGKVVNGKTTAPGEIRGDKIEGGETREVKAGDVIHIAPKTPHQVVLKKGQKIDYVALKVDAK
jgi:mannose-6-phosphate isomerase-like protein (cupin superfamily)